MDELKKRFRVTDITDRDWCAQGHHRHEYVYRYILLTEEELSQVIVRLTKGVIEQLRIMIKNKEWRDAKASFISQTANIKHPERWPNFNVRRSGFFGTNVCEFIPPHGYNNLVFKGLFTKQVFRYARYTPCRAHNILTPGYKDSG